jgi:hypothetical protein
MQIGEPLWQVPRFYWLQTANKTRASLAALWAAKRSKPGVIRKSCEARVLRTSCLIYCVGQTG